MKTKLRRLLILTPLALIVFTLSPATTATSSADFCTQCEDNCYRYSDNVKDYNACVLLCNYAGNCGIPIIQ